MTAEPRAIDSQNIRKDTPGVRHRSGAKKKPGAKSGVMRRVCISFACTRCKRDRFPQERPGPKNGPFATKGLRKELHNNSALCQIKQGTAIHTSPDQWVQIQVQCQRMWFFLNALLSRIWLTLTSKQRLKPRMATPSLTWKSLCYGIHGWRVHR